MIIDICLEKNKKNRREIKFLSKICSNKVKEFKESEVVGEKGATATISKARVGSFSRA